MTYFCFIESSILSVPHMEPLAADDPHTAKIEAEALLKQHGSGYAAHVFEGNRRVGTVRRDLDAFDPALDRWSGREPFDEARRSKCRRMIAPPAAPETATP